MGHDTAIMSPPLYTEVGHVHLPLSTQCVVTFCPSCPILPVCPAASIMQVEAANTRR